ncbi:MAG TPA: YebC/PmpR family DNA-binding transcriptional regulator [Steroidobacteraceae bacterium]|nr:YebC/PmpR family DNA-binding transcriptional regulator [Steroidobacteraceae bacterium]
MAGHSKWVSIRYRRGTSGKSRDRGRAPRDSARTGGPPSRFRCEGYGPGGAAVMMDCLTDSRERTVAQVRQLLQRYGGSLGANGAVSYLFNQVGLMLFPPGTDEDRLTQSALEAGAEDVVVSSDGTIEVLADPFEFETVRALLLEKGFVPNSAEVTERAATSVRLAGDGAVAMLLLLEALEDLEDILNVYTNAEISDEVLARV